MRKTPGMPGPRHLLVLAVAAAGIAAAFFLPPIAQDPAYHDFADRRAWLGVANFWNLASNIPFALVGLYGLGRLAGLQQPALRPAYAIICIGTVLVGAGSAYYHFAPSTPTLVWDRLPMSIAFMALLAAVIQDRMSPKTGRALLGPLVVIGMASVAWWSATELRGQGDLRPYAVVQFLPLLLMPLMLLLFRGAGIRDRWLWVAIGTYALAKLAEHFDAAIYAAGGIVGGHSLKHLLAALAALWILRAFWRDGAATASRGA